MLSQHSLTANLHPKLFCFLLDTFWSAEALVTSSNRRNRCGVCQQMLAEWRRGAACRRHPHVAPVVSIKLLDDHPSQLFFFFVRPKCWMAKTLQSHWIRQNANMGLLAGRMKKTFWTCLGNVENLLDTWTPIHKMNGEDTFHLSGLTSDYEQQEKDTRASTDLVPQVFSG